MWKITQLNSTESHIVNSCCFVFLVLDWEGPFHGLDFVFMCLKGG